jgi:hypothetical protein
MRVGGRRASHPESFRGDHEHPLLAPAAIKSPGISKGIGSNHDECRGDRVSSSGTTGKHCIGFPSRANMESTSSRGRAIGAVAIARPRIQDRI